MEEFVDWCIEWPNDERGIKYVDAIAWANEVLPTSFFMNDGELQDQKKEWWTYGCVYYANSHWNNLLNFLEGSSVRSKGSDMCKWAVDNDMLDVKSWTLIVNGPKSWVKMWYLDGYAELYTIDEMKHSIANKRPVQCWSNSLDWFAATEENGWRVMPWKSYWHSVLLDWYDDKKEAFRIKQSYLMWDSGHQWIGYEHVNLLYSTRYSLIDKADSLITNYKKTVMENISIDSAKDAMTEGFWNGLSPKETATREEVAAMVMRAYNKLKDAR